MGIVDSLVRNVDKAMIMYKVGNDRKISLWYDRWLPSGSISGIINGRCIFNSGFGLGAKVFTVINDGKWKWPTGSRDYRNLQNLYDNLYNPSVNDDKVEWILQKNGVFSTATAWELIRKKGVEVMASFDLVL